MAAIAGVAASRAVGLPLPPCPLRSLTGIPCPGCGAGRCVTALLDGDVAAALDANSLVTVALILLTWSAVVVLARWVGVQLWDPLRARHASRMVATVVGAFWLLRLIPVGPAAWLAP